MRMDDWVAAFGSEELSGDDDLESEPIFFDDVLNTASSFCDAKMLWVPATEDTNSLDEEDALNYSCSESSSSSFSETITECSPHACDLQCVCVDCLKCPTHCTCNYSSNDYKRRVTAVVSTKNRTKHNTQVASDHDNKVHFGHHARTFHSKDSIWSSAHSYFPPSRPKKQKQPPNKKQGYMVVPNNICVEAFFMESADDDRLTKGPSRHRLDSRQDDDDDEEEDRPATNDYNFLEESLKATFGTFDNFRSRSNCSQTSLLQPREIFP